MSLQAKQRLEDEARPLGPSFEEEWPDLARRLNSMLGGKRIPHDRREDIVQETGLRLFRMWKQVDPDRPVWALAVTIALNLVRDEARRAKQREVLGPVPELVVASDDVERAGIARLELHRVEKALTQLTPAHRSVLLAEVGDEMPDDTRGANAIKMLRMRARRRLSSILEAASVLSGVVGLRVRRLLGIEQYFVALRPTTAPIEPATASAAVGIVAALAIMGLAGPVINVFTTPPGPDNGPPGIGRQAEAVTAWDATSGTPSLNGSRSIAIGSSSSSDRGRDARSSGSNPYRLGVPTGGGFVEGEFGLGLMGIGVEIGDRDGAPACISGDPVPQGVPLRCRKAQGGEKGPAGLTAKAYVRAKFKGHEVAFYARVE